MSRNNKPRGELRIIGGQWRGRRLKFEPQEGLRPTLDRYRETLFNWLMHHVEGSRCLDLFAGSGALGLEALSRGATQVDFVDSHPASCSNIRHHLHTLGSKNGRVHQAQAAAWLKSQTGNPGSDHGYDLIFLDPPFNQDLLQNTCYLLEYNEFIQPHTLIYLEAEPQFNRLVLPSHWQVNKHKQSKSAAFFLLQCPTPTKLTS